MDATAQCIREHGGLVPVRRTKNGQFDETMSFTLLVRDIDRIHGIRVPIEAIGESWATDLRTWGGTHPRLCLMERIAPSFKFFVHAQLPPGVDALAMVPTLRTIIREFGFSANQCAVMQDSLDTSSNRFVWDDVIVNSHRAYILRERIAAELSSRDTGAYACSYRWTDVFAGPLGKMYDTCLPGPTFPGSLKFGTCEECGNGVAKRKECTRCARRGVSILPGVMQPLALMEFDDAGAVSRHPTTPTWSSCIIHTTSPVSDDAWRIPAGTPFCGYTEISPKPTGGLWNSRRKQAPSSLHIRKLLQDAIRSSNTLFKQLVVTERSVTSASPDKYVIHPVGIGAHNCIKFRSEHTDSYVYFVVTPRGVTQRCYSLEALSCGTSCKQKVAQNVSLEERVLRELFPSSSTCDAVSISNSTQTSAFQLASRVSDYHANLCKGAATRKRNVYGDIKSNPMAHAPRSTKRQFGQDEDEV